MKDLKLLLACVLGLGMSMSLVACDVDEDDTDGGAVGDGGVGGTDGDGGVEGDGGATAPELTRIVIVDTSDDENAAGTPGADICGVSADCGARALTGSASIDQSETDNICDERGKTVGGSQCSANRHDPAAAEDTGAACVAASAPVSDYIALGLGGILTVDFDQDLRGCTINVVELEGRDAESYEVHACPADAEVGSDDCVLLGTADGGNFSEEVPAGE